MIDLKYKAARGQPYKARTRTTAPMTRARVAFKLATAGVAYTETLRATQRIYDNINENTSGN